jgi:hypothetical protein
LVEEKRAAGPDPDAPARALLMVTCKDTFKVVIANDQPLDGKARLITARRLLRQDHDSRWHPAHARPGHRTAKMPLHERRTRLGSLLCRNDALVQ